MGNKNQELDCLNRVFQYEKQSKGKIKQFIHSLSNYDKKETERPDFIFQNDAYCIGLEHFSVDHLSQKNKNNKIASNGIIGRKAFENFKVKCVNKKDISDKELDKLFEEFINIISNQSEKALNATYPIFIESFKYSLNTHLNKFEEYKSNLKEQFTGKVYLGFLIEIHAEFGYLFLNNKRGSEKIKHGHTLMFFDIVEMVKQSCKDKIDFIIFCTGEKIYKNSDRVYIASVKDIENDLEKQRVKIYRYAAEDCILSNFQSMQADLSVRPKITNKNENFNVVFNLSQRLMVEEDKVDLIFFAFYRAYYAKINNFNYACSAMILCLIEVFLKYVIKWVPSENEQEKWKIRPVFYPVPKEILNREIDELEKRWGITTNDET